MENQMHEAGMISDNLTIKTTEWRCVYQNPRPTWPEDFCHMTLLNADLKLLRRILAKRLSQWLNSMLHPSQHCGMNGITTYEALATVREAIACTEYRRTSMCILSLELGKPSKICLTSTSSNVWKHTDSTIGSNDTPGICTGVRRHLYMSVVTDQENFPSNAPWGKVAHWQCSLLRYVLTHY
jgi:hypothetical protein